jgi:hypothetical protein
MELTIHQPIQYSVILTHHTPEIFSKAAAMQSSRTNKLLTRTLDQEVGALTYGFTLL